MRDPRRLFTVAFGNRGGWRRWTALGALALLLVGCGAGQTSSVSGTLSTATATPPAARTPGGVPTNAAALGERREQDGLALTVLGASGTRSINQALVAQGDAYYLILDVVIENVSLAQARYQRYNFVLTDASGQSFQQAALAPQPALPTGGDLRRGARAEGKVAFEVPSSAKDLSMAFTPGATGGGDAIRVRVGDAVAYVPPTAGGASAAPAATGTARTGGASPTPTPRATRAAGSAAPSARPSAAPAVGGQPYRDPQGRFSFTPPEGWTQNPSTATTIRFDAPGNAATLNLNLEDVSNIPGLTLDQYDAAIERQLARQFVGYATVGKEQVTIGGQPAYRRTITATSSGTPLRIITFYLLKSETAHVMIMAAPQADFDRFSPIFEGVIGSYRTE